MPHFALLCVIIACLMIGFGLTKRHDRRYKNRILDKAMALHMLDGPHGYAELSSRLMMAERESAYIIMRWAAKGWLEFNRRTCLYELSRKGESMIRQRYGLDVLPGASVTSLADRRSKAM